MSLPIKTYIPNLARETYNMCRFITKHRVTILAVVTVISPGDLPAVAAAFSSIQVACDLFSRLEQALDPNAPPHE
jgi:hypothetical protein